jgi:hypothetical protein
MRCSMRASLRLQQVRDQGRTLVRITQISAKRMLPVILPHLAIDQRSHAASVERNRLWSPRREAARARN